MRGKKTCWGFLVGFGVGVFVCLLGFLSLEGFWWFRLWIFVAVVVDLFVVVLLMMV